jgi:hypothetical protein
MDLAGGANGDINELRAIARQTPKTTVGNQALPSSPVSTSTRLLHCHLIIQRIRLLLIGDNLASEHCDRVAEHERGEPAVDGWLDGWRKRIVQG